MGTEKTKANGKAKGKQTEEEVEASENSAVVVTENLPTVSGLPSLKSMKKGYSLVCNYLAMEEGEVKQFWFAQMVKARFNREEEDGSKGQQEKDAVYLVEDDGSAWIDSSFEMVSSLSKLDLSKGPIPVEVTYLGRKAAKDGKGKPIMVKRYLINRLS
jgi:hypothetical protein